MFKEEMVSPSVAARSGFGWALLGVLTMVFAPAALAWAVTMLGS